MPFHITRRGLMQGALTMAATGLATAGYAVGMAPFRERITRYRLTPPRWPDGMRLRVVVIADLHICEPWTGMERLERIVDQANAAGGDVIVLLGDYVRSLRLTSYSRNIAPEIWGPMLGRLKAPGGVHAILGNHDWWEDAEAQRLQRGPTASHRALAAAGIVVHENTATRLLHRDAAGRTYPYWIAGLGDQWAFFGGPRFHADGTRNMRRYIGVDDLTATTRTVTDDAPAILLIHEPDAFPRVPDRFSLTLAGHTHGGQVRFLGFAPVVPSRYGRRYAYGHIVEDGRHLIVSAGLGVSGLPIRFGATPEIVVVDLG